MRRLDDGCQSERSVRLESRLGMTTDRANDQLAALFAAAKRACLDGTSTTDYEPAAAALLDYIQANPSCHEDAMAMVLTGVDDMTPFELIAYLMYELRWPQVKEAVLRGIDANEDWRIKTALSHILEAFDDDWEDIVMYERWKASKTT